VARVQGYKGPLVWTLGVAAATLVFGPARGISPGRLPVRLDQTKAASIATTSNPATPGQAALPQSNPARAVREFWALAGPEDGNDFADELLSQAGQMDVDFLIAAVPDPIDTRFSYRFDSLLDDIQMAIESQNWLLDRFWFPWLPSGRQPSRRDEIKGVIDPILQLKSLTVQGAPVDKAPAAGQSIERRYEMSSAEGSSLPLHETRPGVMVFRRPRKSYDQSEEALEDVSKQTQQVLIVFLVGDRPTSGLQTRALGFAFNVIDRFTREAGPYRCEPPLAPVEFRILAPYFSGSERSLSLTINHWAQSHRPVRSQPPNVSPGFGPRYQFVVRCGSANRIDRNKFLSDCQSGHSLSEVEVAFAATVHHFDLLMRAIFEFLRAQNGGRDLGKVALLTESDTEFGRGVPERDKIKAQWGVRTLTRMDFPFHISQLAAAYDATRAPNDNGAPILPRSSSKLRIPFDEIGSPSDTVPAMAPRMTAATEEFNLAKILETISMEDYRYVGIVATDTRDVIFLGGLIREFCPDVHLFTTAADLLLGHPDYSPQLRGMLVASPYPIFSMAQRWDPPHEGDMRRHLFMHQSDQGYYNATVTLVVRGRSGVGLEWFPQVADEKDLPSKRQNCIVIASPGKKRLFCVFDENGRKTTTDAKALPGRRAQIDALWKFLSKRHKPAVLTGAEKEGVLSAVSTILGRSLDTQYFDYLFDYGKPFDEMDELAWWRRRGTPALNRGDVYTPTANDVRLPVWLGAVGTRGLWPLMFLSQPDVVLADGGFSLRPTADDMPHPTPRTDGSTRESDHWVNQFIPLVPQFSWGWGTLALLILSLAWGTLQVHVRLAREASYRIEEVTDTSWRQLSTLRPLSGPGTLTTLRLWHLAASLGILALIGVVAYVHVVEICRLTLRHSAWSDFFPVPYFRRWMMLPWGDLWNWGFALFLIWGSRASILALAAAAILRIDLTLDAARDDENQPGNPDKHTVKSVSAALERFSDYFRDRRQGPLSWFGIFIALPAGVLCFTLLWAWDIYKGNYEQYLMTDIAWAVFGTLVASLGAQVVVAWTSLHVDPPAFTMSNLKKIEWSMPMCLALAGLLLAIVLLGGSACLTILGVHWTPYTAINWALLIGSLACVSLVLGSAVWERASQNRHQSNSGAVDLPTAAPLLLVVGLIALTVQILVETPRQVAQLWLQVPVSVIAALGIWLTVRDVRCLKNDTRCWLAGWYSVLSPRSPKQPSSDSSQTASGAPPVAGSIAVEPITPDQPSSGSSQTASGAPPVAGSVPEEPITQEKRNQWGIGIIWPSVASLLIVMFELLMGEPGPPYAPLLYLERAVSMTSGVSPLVPCLLLAAAAGAWLLGQLRRMDYVHSLWGDRIHEGWASPYELEVDKQLPGSAKSVVLEMKKRLTDASESVHKLLSFVIPRGIWTHPLCLLFLGLTVVVGVRLIERYVPTIDGIWFNRGALLTVAVLEFMIALSLCRLLLTWTELSRLLREVALLPMQVAFRRIPVVLSREFGPYLNASRPTLKNLEISVRQWVHVACDWEDKLVRDALKIGCGNEPVDSADNGFGKLSKDFRAIILKYSKDPDTEHRNPARGLAISEKFLSECQDRKKLLQSARSDIRKDLRQAAAACLSIVIPYWDSKTVTEGYGDGEGSGRNSEDDKRRGGVGYRRRADQDDEERLRSWVEAAEVLFALEMVNFASECTVQLKNLAQFLTAGPLLLLLAVTSYPFQPQRFMVVTISSLLVAVSAGLLWTYIQMERNEVLSLVSNTQPNKLNWSWTLFGQLMTVIVPLVGAALTQFPSLSDVINGWIEPILRVVK
jgi:hypothetical protein